MHPDLLRLADSTAWSRGVLMVAAHPDDETIGAGGVMADLPLLGIAHATDGAPADRRWWGDPTLPSREAYAQVRRAELASALALAGVGAERMRWLGRQDQRAALDLAGLAEEVAAVIEELRPGIVLTHPYEGGHPDHDAAAFAAHVARGLVACEPPVLVEFTSYHAAGEGIATGTFLPCEAGSRSLGGDRSFGLPSFAPRQDSRGRPQDDDSGEVAILLSADDRQRKRRMLECFGSQRETLAQFPVREAERFRIAPEYDFALAPHAGTLHYERFHWGITGAEWRALAAGALDALGTGAARC